MENSYKERITDPLHSIVIDPQSIANMLHGEDNKTIDKITQKVCDALEGYFSHDSQIKNIIYKKNPSKNNIRESQRIYTSKPSIIVLSGIPGAGKSTYSKILATENKKTLLITNDLIRASITGLTEGDITKKIWQTDRPSDNGEIKSLGILTFPIINKTKDIMIETLLSNGYNIVIDAPHQFAEHRDGFEKYKGKATILHYLIKPVTLKKSIEMAAKRQIRPEGKEVIQEINHALYNLGLVKNSDGTLKYNFDKIIINNYSGKNGFIEEK